MADLADMADRQSEGLIEARVLLASRFEAEASPTGECLYCGVPVASDRRWCCPDCRDGWEHERKLRGISK